MKGDGRAFLCGRVWWVSFYGPTKKGIREIKESARTTSERTARKVLERRVRQVRNHREGLARFIDPTERRTKLNKLLDALVLRMKAEGRKSLRTAGTQLRHVREKLGHFNAHDLTPTDLRDYQQHRVGQGAAPATVDRELELLGRAFRIALADGKVASVPVTPKLLKGNGNARRGFLTPEKFDALINQIDDSDFNDWLLWFWWPGMRNGETSSLTWDGLEEGDPSLLTLFAENAKIGETRKLPLVGPLREIIDRRMLQKLPSCPLVFHSNGISFKANHGGLPKWCYEMWAKACKAIGLPDLRPYDLRRSAVRNLIHSGVPELTAMKISGHKTWDTFRRYAIEDPSEIATAIETVAAYVKPRMKAKGRVLKFPGHAQNTPNRD